MEDLKELLLSIKVFDKNEEEKEAKKEEKNEAVE